MIFHAARGARYPAGTEHRPRDLHRLYFLPAHGFVRRCLERKSCLSVHILRSCRHRERPAVHDFVRRFQTAACFAIESMSRSVRWSGLDLECSLISQLTCRFSAIAMIRSMISFIKRSIFVSSLSRTSRENLTVSGITLEQFGSMSILPQVTTVRLSSSVLTWASAARMHSAAVHRASYRSVIGVAPA